MEIRMQRVAAGSLVLFLLTLAGEGREIEYSVVQGNKSGNKTFCQTSPAHLNKTASITCHFSEDVSQTKRNFKVQRKDFGVKWTTDSEMLLECVWHKDAENASCEGHSGFYVVTQTNNTLTIETAHFQMDLVGEYVCQMVGKEDEPSGSCKMTLAEPKAVSMRSKIIWPMTGCLVLVVIIVTSVGCLWARYVKRNKYPDEWGSRDIVFKTCQDKAKPKPASKDFAQQYELRDVKKYAYTQLLMNSYKGRSSTSV